MSEQFHIYLNTETDAQSAERRLRSLKVNDRALMKVERKDKTSVFAGAGIYDEIPKTAVLTSDDSRSVPFFDLFYQADTLKSGKHHPDGALWIRTQSRCHHRYEDRVSLRSVAPTILAQFGITPPPYMRAQALEVDAQAVAV